MARRNDALRNEVLESIKAGIHTAPEIAMLHNRPSQVVGPFMARMVDRGELVRIRTGYYDLPNSVPPAPEPTTMIGALNHIVENIKRVVEIPPFLKRRKPVKIVIIRDEETLDGLLKLELKIGEVWLPIYFDDQHGLRMLLGRQRPNWSGTQVTYENVSAYRVTLVDGTQYEVGHDRAQPLTIDGLPESESE